MRLFPLKFHKRINFKSIKKNSIFLAISTGIIFIWVRYTTGFWLSCNIQQLGSGFSNVCTGKVVPSEGMYIVFIIAIFIILKLLIWIYKKLIPSKYRLALKPRDFLNVSLIIKTLIIFTVSCFIFLLTLQYTTGFWNTCEEREVFYSCVPSVTNCPFAGFEKECHGPVLQTDFNYLVVVLIIFLVLEVLIKIYKKFLHKKLINLIRNKAFQKLLLLLVLLAILVFGVFRYALSIPIIDRSGIDTKPVPTAEMILAQNGCKYDGTSWDCYKSQIKEDYNCDEVALQDNRYGGGMLTKLYQCLNYSQDKDTTEIYRIGCKRQARITYLLFNGSFIILNENSDIASLFGQEISSTDSAVLFAKLVTGNEVWKTIDIKEGSILIVDKSSIKPTHGISSGDGFDVNLFSYRLCSCGDHYYSEVIYHVTKGGDIKEVSSRELFSPPGSQGLCID